MSDRKTVGSDIDERGICPRDIIEGDILTLIGFKGQKRRVILAAFLAGEMPNHRVRRQMGWILPSLDGDPPNPLLVSQMVRCHQNRERKAYNIANQKALAEAREKKRQEKRERKLRAKMEKTA